MYALLVLVFLFARKKLSELVVGLGFGILWGYMMGTMNEEIITLSLLFAYAVWISEMAKERLGVSIMKADILSSIPGIVMVVIHYFTFYILLGWTVVVVIHNTISRNSDKILPMINRVIYRGGGIDYSDMIPKNIERMMIDYLGPTTTNILLEKWSRECPDEILKKSKKVLKEVAGVPKHLKGRAKS